MVAGSRKAASPPFDVLVATGLREDFLKFPGSPRGRVSAVLHCPYCRGWEGARVPRCRAPLLDQCQCTRLRRSIS